MTPKETIEPKEPQAPIHVGRVFFEKEGDLPHKVRVVTLECHVNNVHTLSQHWRCIKDAQEHFGTDETPREPALYEKTAGSVRSAALHHDDAKPKCFRITYAPSKGFGYSFASHRFKVPPKEPYEDELIRGHHDFSVSDITEAAFRLRETLQEQGTQTALSQLAQEPERLLQRYRDDLYILEMCDQIEASIETLALSFGDYEPRNFMDFSLQPLTKEESKNTTAPTRTDKQLSLLDSISDTTPSTDEENTYQLDPWPFAKEDESHLPSLTMTYQFVDLVIPADVCTELAQKAKIKPLPEAKEKDHPAAKRLQEWLLDALNKQPQVQTQSVRLLPCKEEHKTPTREQCEAFLGFALNPMQEAMLDRLQGGLEDGCAVMLRGPTGSGKTEAIVIPSLITGRRLILALPTRSLLDDHAERINRILTEAAQETKRSYTMIIDTGTSKEQWCFDRKKGKKRGNPRHLYKADIILTTLDKLVYRYFGYTDKTKSMIFPHRLAQSKTLICFDEAHSYDGLAWTNFRMLTEALYKVGQDLVLMTATMPQKLLAAFDYLDTLDFGAGAKRAALTSFMQEAAKASGQDVELFPGKRLHWHDVPYPSEEEAGDPFARERVYDEAVAAALYTKLLEVQTQKRRRVIVITNTVRAAIEIYQQAKDNKAFTKHFGEVILYHGRLASHRYYQAPSSSRKEKVKHPRSERFKVLKERDEGGKPYLLITTHAIEVGCDLDAEVLLTACCPPDGLIQRAGRCNRRHQHKDAELHVVGAHVPSYLNYMNGPTTSAYIQSLQAQEGQSFDSDALSPYMVREQELDDPRQVEMFTMLYAYVYEGEVMYKPLHEKGLLAIRSWEPTVTVRINMGSGFFEELSVPLERLRLGPDDESAPEEVSIHELAYDPSRGIYDIAPLRGGEAYRKREIIVEISPIFLMDGESADETYYTPDLGLHQPPPAFRIWRNKSGPKKHARDMSVRTSNGGKVGGAILTYLAPYH